MAQPSGRLVRFPILDALGDDHNSAISQAAASAEINLKMNASDGYNKAETNKLLNDLITDSLGDSTVKAINQNLVTIELNKRYTKTETQELFYSKQQTTDLINQMRNKASPIADVVSTSLAPRGIYIGAANALKGPHPDLGTNRIKFESNVLEINPTFWQVFQTIEVFPTSGDATSGDYWQRGYDINPETNVINAESGWSRLRYRWST